MGRRAANTDAIDKLGLQLDLSHMAKVNLQDRVYMTLRTALIRGQFEPGTQLTIRALAKMLGTSIIPVRDALQRLIAERSLEVLENRSACVPEMTRESFQELVGIRLMLEGAAVERIPGGVTHQQIDDLDLANRKFELAVQRNDPEAVTQANMEFHFNLYRLAEGSLLLDMIETLWVRAGPMLRIPYRIDSYDPNVFQEGVLRHREIIEALTVGDRKKARHALEQDIADTANWYNDHLGPS